MGGVDKAMLDVAGSTMLDRVLAAAAPTCDELVVVGPTRRTAIDGVRFTVEAQRGGGPVPAVAAGLAEVPEADAVVVLAVDLPLLRPEHVQRLLAGLDDRTFDAVAARDQRGRPNALLAAYRAGVLRTTVDGLGADVAAARLLPDATAVVDLGEAGTLNVNQPEDLARARHLLRPAP
jgi:molybdopterin molybdotransferase